MADATPIYLSTSYSTLPLLVNKTLRPRLKLSHLSEWLSDDPKWTVPLFWVNTMASNLEMVILIQSVSHSAICHSVCLRSLLDDGKRTIICKKQKWNPQVPEPDIIHYPAVPKNPDHKSYDGWQRAALAESGNWQFWNGNKSDLNLKRSCLQSHITKSSYVQLNFLLR